MTQRDETRRAQRGKEKRGFDQSRGDQSRGDQTRGDQSRGDQTRRAPPRPLRLPLGSPAASPAAGDGLPLPDAEREARLRLHLTPGVGPRRFHRLLAELGSAQAALRAAPAHRVRVLGPRCAEALMDASAHAARLESARRVLASLGARVRLYGDPAYPGALLRLAPPPPALWVRGAHGGSVGWAVVGMRRATRRGCEHARAIAEAAAAQGEPVISGGAYGIDAAAHEGALAAGGPTLVVFGGGLDRPYPDRHRPLFERVAGAGGGAVLSPFPPGTPPLRGGFLARNALIAALSRAVVVVEAGWRSGALNTASHARRLGLPVFAVPGSPGTERLLSEGARPLLDPTCLPDPTVPPGDGRAGGTVGSGTTPAPPPGSTVGGDPGPGSASCSHLTDDEARLLAALAALGRALPDQVAERTGQPPAVVLGGLMALVMQGLAIQEPGGWYRPLTTVP